MTAPNAVLALLNRTCAVQVNCIVIRRTTIWKRILIVDDDKDINLTFKAGIEDSSNHTIPTEELKYVQVIIL